MKLVETLKSLRIYTSHITKPRAAFFDLLVSTAIYELFCNKNALEVGCFTGANTLHLANIAKAKNTTVIALDNWQRPCEEAGAKNHSHFMEKDFNKITIEDIGEVDYVFFDVEFTSTENLLTLFNKIPQPSKFFFLVDDVRNDEKFFKLQEKRRNFNIDNFIEQTSTVEILRSINRSYIAVGYTDEEIIEFKRELSEVISFGKHYLNNMWASEKIYYESESNKIKT